MVSEIAVRVFVDMRIIQIDFPVLDSGKGIGDLPLSCSKGFYLGPVQNDARLEGLQNVIVPSGFGVSENIGHETILHEAGLCRAASVLRVSIERILGTASLENRRRTERGLQP